MSEQHDPLRDFAVTVELPVLWGHMDAFQHVNNTIFFRYFESARIEYGDRIGMYEFIEKEGIGPILAATNCTFLKPLRYPDTLQVGCRTTRISESEMDQEYVIYSQRLSKLAATGSGKIVAYDYNRLKKAHFPEPMIARILELERELRRS